jgi:hypothetical protein
VLDENVVVFASTLTDEKGNRDLACSGLVNRIVAGIHRIAWSIDVYARWSDKVQWLRARGEALDPTFMTLLSQILIDADKCPFPDTGNPPALPGEPQWSTKLLDDKDFVRLAAYFRCLLATTDAPLQRELRDTGIEAHYGFRSVLLVDALRLAEDATP